MGYAIAGWVGAGTYYSSNLSFQWRFPIALSIIPPFALALCAPWIPESPRWRTWNLEILSAGGVKRSHGSVLTRDRRDEAWDIVKRLHGGDAEDEGGLQYAREEFYQMTHQVQADAAAWKEGGGWGGMLKNKTYRKRFWMGFFIQVWLSPSPRRV